MSEISSTKLCREERKEDDKTSNERFLFHSSLSVDEDHDLYIPIFYHYFFFSLHIRFSLIRATDQIAFFSFFLFRQQIHFYSFAKGK